MPWDWTAFANTIVASLIGTSIGALVAFWIDDRKERERRRAEEQQRQRQIEDRRVTDANIAIFALSRAWRDLEYYRQDAIEPVRASTAKWYAMGPGQIYSQTPSVEPDSLAFLFESDAPDLPAQVQFELDRYAAIRSVIRERYNMHVERLQAKFDSVTWYGELSEESASRLAGPALHRMLSGMTDAIIAGIDEALPSIKATALQLRAVVSKSYPARKIIRFQGADNG